MSMTEKDEAVTKPADPAVSAPKTWRISIASSFTMVHDVGVDHFWCWCSPLEQVPDVTILGIDGEYSSSLFTPLSQG